MKPLLSIILNFTLASLFSQNIILPNLLPQATPADIDTFNFISNAQLGIAGDGFYNKGLWIGMCPAEDDDYGSPLDENTWYPRDGYKKTVCGTIVRKDNFQDVEDADARPDHDFTFNLATDPAYDYLARNSWDHVLGTDAAYFPECTINFNENKTKKELHLEVGFNDEGGENFVTDEDFMHVNDKACGYGAWVQDKGHCNILYEIHPVEQFWSRDSLDPNLTFYRLAYTLDSRGRFESLDDYDCENEGDVATIWAPNPLTDHFYIPFSIPFALGHSVDFWIFDALSNPRRLVNNDANDITQLVYLNDVFATIHNPTFTKYKVSFNRVKRSGNNLIGYIKITCILGNGNQTGGFAFLDALKQINTKPPDVFNQTWQLNINSIKKIPVEGLSGYQHFNGTITLMDEKDTLSIPVSLDNNQTEKINHAIPDRNQFLISAQINTDKLIKVQAVDEQRMVHNGELLLQWDPNHYINSERKHNDFSGDLSRDTITIIKDFEVVIMDHDATGSLRRITTDTVGTTGGDTSSPGTAGTRDFVKSPIYSFEITYTLIRHIDHTTIENH